MSLDKSLKKKSFEGISTYSKIGEGISVVAGTGTRTGTGTGSGTGAGTGSGVRIITIGATGT